MVITTILIGILCTIVGFCLGRLEREEGERPSSGKFMRLGNGGYVRTGSPGKPPPPPSKFSRKV